MKSIFILSLLISAAATTTITTTTTVVLAEEVIVFVHGLSGYGVDEKDGDYWGPQGANNYVTWLQAQTGLRAFEASVGPFSSNYDRACELYAQILGLRTDYGIAHSTAQNHERYGRDFRANPSQGYYNKGGLFPQWSSSNRIHFVVHSMGGLTVRYLERFLRQGNPSEMQVTYPADEPRSALFQTGLNRDMIASIISLASPFDGSTLHTKLFFQKLPFVWILKTVMFKPLLPDAQAGKFNFDLDHHPDFKRKVGESNNAYADRFFDSPKWDGNGYDDLADSDLSPDENKRFNAAGPRVFPNTRYFALNTVKTKPCALNFGDQCGSGTTGFYGITSGYMGSMDDLFGNNPIKDKAGNVYDAKWEPNDGLVSEISSRGPTYGLSTSVKGNPVLHPSSTTGFIYSKTSLATETWYYRRFELDHSQIKDDITARNHVRDIIKAIKA